MPIQLGAESAAVSERLRVIALSSKQSAVNALNRVMARCVHACAIVLRCVR